MALKSANGRTKEGGGRGGGERRGGYCTSKYETIKIVTYLKPKATSRSAPRQPPGWPHGEGMVPRSFLNSCGGKGGVTGHAGDGIGAGGGESWFKKMIHHKK